MTLGQTLSRSRAKEQGTADSINNYLVASKDEYDYPLFDFVLGDIDRLFRINRLMNAHDILIKFDLKAITATDTIDRLSKLVTGGGVNNIGEQGTLGVLQTMSSFDTFHEISRYFEFKV